MLRVAVPNKGALSEPASALLQEAGYRQRRQSRELVLVDAENQVEFFFIRPRDVAIYVGTGTVDVGITGRDLLLDSRADAVEHLPLGFARSTFKFAAPAGTMTTLEDLRGKRIATSYDHLVRMTLDKRNIEAKVVHLDGAVESSVRLGVADAVADVVETGSTLRAAGLETFGETLLESEAVLICRAGQEPDGLQILDRRLRGVLTARAYVMLDYDVPAKHLEEAADIARGIQSPTISNLHDNGWYAVRIMVPRDSMNATMDKLYDAGARGIVVTPIFASRL